jgi:hypothetical protein
MARSTSTNGGAPGGELSTVRRRVGHPNGRSLPTRPAVKRWPYAMAGPCRLRMPGNHTVGEWAANRRTSAYHHRREWSRPGPERFRRTSQPSSACEARRGLVGLNLSTKRNAPSTAPAPSTPTIGRWRGVSIANARSEERLRSLAVAKTDLEHRERPQAQGISPRKRDRLLALGPYRVWEMTTTTALDRKVLLRTPIESSPHSPDEVVILRPLAAVLG